MTQQFPGQAPSRHSKYEPFVWIFWVRMVQLVLAIVVIALSGFAMSQSWLALGLSFSMFTIVWSLIYIPLSVWGVPRLAARYRPNIIVLVFESLSVLWWLTAFALLATTAAGGALLGYKRMIKRYNSSDYSDLVNDVYDNYGSSSSSSIYDDAFGYNSGNVVAAFACIKAAAALSAINWALFVATLVAIAVRIHRQRRDRVQEIYTGASNAPVNNNVAESQTNIIHDPSKPE